ncbi:MAG: GNAT family N-acetyltransferase [Acetobacter sp.]|nr:GNAT family N-acetyltransferase [Acetobacter sp.]
MKIRKVKFSDKEFIVKANLEIDKISGTTDESFLDRNFEKDFVGKRPKCKCIVIEDEQKPIGFCIYSYVYWSNTGLGIYLSNAYILPEYRKKGALNKMLKYIKNKHNNVVFFTGMVGKGNKLMQNIMTKKYGAEDVNLITYSIRF